MNKWILGFFEIASRHWISLSGFSLALLFFISFMASHVYYRTFGIDSVSFLEWTDYPKILIQENKIPFLAIFAPLTAICAIAFHKTNFKEILEVIPALDHWWSRALWHAIPSLLFAFAAYQVLILPISQVMRVAEIKKLHSSELVTVQLKGQMRECLVLAGGTSRYMFFYDRAKASSFSIRSELIDSIETDYSCNKPKTKN